MFNKRVLYRILKGVGLDPDGNELKPKEKKKSKKDKHNEDG